MKHRLLLSNIFLIGLVCVIGWTLRQRWLDARAHERGVLATRVPPAPAPKLPPVPATPPVFADRYAEIAQKMLFAKDRNPTVIVDPVPPPKEKPVPPFPVAHGVMIWPGVPAAVILSEKAKSEQRSFHVGDKVGEFAIGDITTQKLVLEWDGKTFEKNLVDLEDKGAAAQTASAPPPPPPSDSSQPLAETNLHQEPVNGPGVQISDNERACTSSDTSPVGAVVDGYRKNVVLTPMGKSCDWMKVGQ